MPIENNTSLGYSITPKALDLTSSERRNKRKACWPQRHSNEKVSLLCRNQSSFKIAEDKSVNKNENCSIETATRNNAEVSEKDRTSTEIDIQIDFDNINDKQNIVKESRELLIDQLSFDPLTTISKKSSSDVLDNIKKFREQFLMNRNTQNVDIQQKNSKQNTKVMCLKTTSYGENIKACDTPGIPERTKKQNRWAFNVWREWAKKRNIQVNMT